MSRWDPHIDLMQLLEALGSELAATTEGEAAQACAEAGRSLKEVAKDIWELIGAASGDPVETEADPFDPDIGLRKGRVELDGSRPHGIIAERGSRPHCRQH